MTTNTITTDRADAIRDRFIRLATEGREQIAALRGAGRDADADAMERQCESWERMAAKRYEAMTARAI